jgi:RNA polymerase sigma-70 factor (ECF subfamily)
MLPPDPELVRRLRDGDRDLFREVVAAYQGPMVRFARTFLPTQAAAEEVAQEAWIGVIRGLDRFEARSSFKTWLFRIVANQARTKGERERRSVPLSALQDELADDGPSVDPERFAGPAGRGQWARPPDPWDEQPETAAVASVTLQALRETIDQLPENQRRVLVMRDVEGLTSGEVRGLLGLSEGNQRVLLHRARSKLRAALEEERR